MLEWEGVASGSLPCRGRDTVLAAAAKQVRLMMLMKLRLLPSGCDKTFIIIVLNRQSMNLFRCLFSEEEVELRLLAVDEL